MKKFFESLAILFFVYTVGPAIYLVRCLFESVGMVEITNPGNLPKLEQGMIVACNHPDAFDFMYEIFLLPALFVPQILRHPLKLAPYFTPDNHNFTDKWYWFWLKPFAMPVQREKGNGSLKLAREKFSALASKRPDMLFIEGGRTCTLPEENLVKSPLNCGKMRIVKNSFGKLVQRTQCSIVTIWLDNGNIPSCPGKPLFSWPNFKRGPVVVTLGERVDFSVLKDKEPKEISTMVSQKMLKLADLGRLSRRAKSSLWKTFRELPHLLRKNF